MIEFQIMCCMFPGQSLNDRSGSQRRHGQLLGVAVWSRQYLLKTHVLNANVCFFVFVRCSVF